MLRKLLTTTALVCLAGTALAADLPYRKSAPIYTPPPPPAFSWTGVYLGGQVGYGWGNSSPSIAGVGLPNGSSQGVVGGAHIGYNYQVSQFVFGLEGDVNGSSERDSGFLDGLSYSQRKNVDASIRGRIGYAFDRILVYGTGGGAYGNFHTSYVDDLGGFDSFNHGRIGWTVGGGIEYAVTNNWSVRAEYRYTDYGHINDDPFDTIAAGNNFNRHERDNRVQVGFSYKFDLLSPPGPVVAKY